MSKIILSKEDFKKVCFEDHEDFDILEEIEKESSRWSRRIELIVRNLNNNKCYICSYEKGSTEMQEDEFYNTELAEVEQKQFTILKWVVKN